MKVLRVTGLFLVDLPSKQGHSRPAATIVTDPKLGLWAFGRSAERPRALLGRRQPAGLAPGATSPVRHGESEGSSTTWT